MGYHTYRTKPAQPKDPTAPRRQPTYVGEQGVYDYTMTNIGIIQTATGDPNVPIHYLGGVADIMKSPSGVLFNNVDVDEMKGFVRAVADSKILGASLYNFRGTTPELWAIWGTISDRLLRLAGSSSSSASLKGPQASAGTSSSSSSDTPA